MSLLDDLRSILTPTQQTPGRIVALRGTVVRVATNQGLIEAAPEGDLVVGDGVVIRDGRAIKMNRGLERVFYV
ncbi:hypothetical protein SIID45300_01069 [Candidatus Magnetaquicoccaceae bacterium FCR-1]|uniref:Flagellum-specific ATP synthase FliI n=1 Tax=Candidatus Magnetaquiglobus chichijimensis TaxID=3141448 RepID=A0ABQ0C797_9PROT